MKKSVLDKFKGKQLSQDAKKAVNGGGWCYGVMWCFTGVDGSQVCRTSEATAKRLNPEAQAIQTAVWC